MASVWMSKPETSLKWASLMPPISRRNRKFLKGSFRMALLPSSWPASGSELNRRRARGELRDAEDHELRGPHGGDPDHHDQPPVVDVVVGHRAAIDADEERFVLRRTEERAAAPLGPQELGDGLLDAPPETQIVG